MFGKKLGRILEIVFLLYLALVMIANVCLQNRFYFVYDNDCRVSNLIFVAGIILIILVIFFFSVKRNPKIIDKFGLFHDSEEIRRKRNIPLMKYVGIAAVILFVVELIYSYIIWFETGWDCYRVVTAAKELALNDNKIGDSIYFSQCPNNVFLTGIFAGILKLVKLLGLKVTTFPLIIVSDILVSLTSFFLCDCVRMLTGKKKLVWLSFAVYVLLTGLSPWISIPYSDTYSILFTTLIIWIYLCKKDSNAVLCNFFMALFGFVGYMIKPSVLLAFIVVVFFDTVHYCVDLRKAGWKKMTMRFLLSLGAVVVALLLTLLLQQGINKATGFTPDEEAKLPIMHFFYMGTNAEFGGVYNQRDVNMTASYPTVAMKNQRDFQEGMARLKEMFPKKLLVFTLQKGLTNFNDGTFAWGHEGTFYVTYYDKPGEVAHFVRSLVYHDGENYGLFVVITQAVWIFVLMLCLLNFIPQRGVEQYSDYKESAVITSMFAIFMFVMVFEARARYLYLFSAVIYMVAMLGLNRLIELGWKIRGRKRKGNES